MGFQGLILIELALAIVLLFVIPLAAATASGDESPDSEKMRQRRPTNCREICKMCTMDEMRRRNGTALEKSLCEYLTSRCECNNGPRNTNFLTQYWWLIALIGVIFLARLLFACIHAFCSGERGRQGIWMTEELRPRPGNRIVRIRRPRMSIEFTRNSPPLPIFPLGASTSDLWPTTSTSDGSVDSERNIRQMNATDSKDSNLTFDTTPPPSYEDVVHSDRATTN